MIRRLYLILILNSVAIAVYSQNNAIASFDLPLNNSFKFNKYLINPTFSFVREDYSAINFYNRRQWSQFENAPQVFFINYSGKVGENSSSSIGLYQQNYGVLTNFGAQVNYAHNVVLSDDSNFTFGFNLSYYNSGLNVGKIVSNSPEPLLQSADSNSLIAFKPGLNFGTGFFDVGLTVNNLFLYNLKTSQMVANDLGKSYVGHIMYTGYMSEAEGLFERAKFSTLIQAEKKTATTAFSGNIILDAPNGGWVQGGYNTIYGVSAGLGILITKNIALGYNYEKGLGDISKLGANHEISFAYIFKNYNDEDYQPLLFRPKPQPQVILPKIDIADKKIKDAEITATRQKLAADAAEKIKAAQEAQTEKLKLANELAANAKIDAAEAKKEKERLALEAINLKKSSDAKGIADAKLKADADKLKSATQTKAITDAEKLLADKQAKAAADAKAIANAKLKADADKLKAANQEKARAAAEKLAADKQAKAAADAKAIANAKLKADADKLKAANQEKTRASAEKLAEDKETKAAADAKAIADTKLKAAADKEAKAAADREKLKAAADAKAITDAKLKADADKLKASAEAKAIADAEKAAADKEAKAAADAANLKAAADAKAIADAKLKADADKLKAAAEKAAADKEAKAAADTEKLKAAADAKAITDAKLKADADKLKASAEAKAIADAEKAAADKEAKAAADAAKLKATADAKAIADAKLKADADKLKAAAEKAVADKEVKAAADTEKLKAAADAKAITDAKLKADADKLKASAEAKAIADAEKAAADKEAKAAADAAKLKAAADAKAIADAKLKADADTLKAAAEAKAIADAEKAAADKEAKAAADAEKAAAEAKAIADAEKAAADKEAKAEADATKLKATADAKAIADAKLKADADKLKAAADAKAIANAKLKAAADAKAAEDAKLLAAQQEKNKAATEAKAKIDRIESIKSDDVVGKELDRFKVEVDFKSNESNKLINKFDSLVKARNSDLQDFKNEGVANADGGKKVQKKFVSATEANKAVEKLKSDIQQNKIVFDNLISEFELKNNNRIKNLKAQGISDADSKTLNDSYLQTLNALKAKRDSFNEKEKQLSAEIESIKTARDLEIRNRIKRAQFDNENEQIKKNQAAIDLLNKNATKNIDANASTLPATNQSSAASSELTIIRNISGIKSGFYLVLDTFNTSDARDTFVLQAISAGAKNVRSFFNFSNNLHYVYIEDFADINSALEAQKTRGTKSYNTKMFTVKVVN